MGDNAAPSRFSLARRLDEQPSCFVSSAIQSTLTSQGPQARQMLQLSKLPDYGMQLSIQRAHTK